MPKSDQPFTVLIVCAANHCRSRTIEAVLQSANLSQLNVKSAGVEVQSALGICSQAEKWLNGRGIFVAPNQLAHRVSQAEVEEADLILTADSDVRSILASEYSFARSRMMTARWAAAASMALLENEIPQRAYMAHSSGHEALVEEIGDERLVIAQALNPKNYHSWIPTELRSAPAIQHPVGGWDIPDVHQGQLDGHTKVFNQCLEMASLAKLVAVVSQTQTM